MKQRMTLGLGISLVAAVALAVPAIAQSPAPGTIPADAPDIAALYQLQAAFHRAASVHDPVNGDSQDVIDGRLREMMDLWMPDGTLQLMVGGPNDGLYEGTGDPTDAATCPPVSGAVGEKRGTICTLFKYVAGSFQAKNRFVSLAPAYLTDFTVHGDTADFYFQCHYFNVATDPWTVASHLVLQGTAKKVGDRWRLWQSYGPVAVDIPVPGQTPAPLASPIAMSMANC